jgi:hypothetical protein
MASLTTLADLKLSYGYWARVHRVFAVDAPAPFDEFECTCHYLGANYRYADGLKLESEGLLLSLA